MAGVPTKLISAQLDVACHFYAEPGDLLNVIVLPPQIYANEATEDLRRYMNECEAKGVEVEPRFMSRLGPPPLIR